MVAEDSKPVNGEPCSLLAYDHHISLPVPAPPGVTTSKCSMGVVTQWRFSFVAHIPYQVYAGYKTKTIVMVPEGLHYGLITPLTLH